MNQLSYRDNPHPWLRTPRTSTSRPDYASPLTCYRSHANRATRLARVLAFVLICGALGMLAACAGVAS